MRNLQREERDIAAAATEGSESFAGDSRAQGIHEGGFELGARWGIAYAQRWVSVSEQMPEANESVWAVAQVSLNRRAIIKADWVPQWSREVNGDYDIDLCDYHTEQDTYYWPEGWYEYCECGENAVLVSGEVYCWQPLPPLPEVPR